MLKKLFIWHLSEYTNLHVSFFHFDLFNEHEYCNSLCRYLKMQKT